MGWLKLKELNQEGIYLTAIVLPLVLQLAGVTFAVSVDRYISKKHRRILLVIVVLALGLMVQNYGEDFLAADMVAPPLRVVFAVVGYVIRPVIILLFFYLVEPEGKYGLAWGLAGLNAVLYGSTLFGLRWTFWISDENHYTRGPLSNFCLYISLVFLVILLLLIAHRFFKTSKRETVIPDFIVFTIIVSLFLDSKVGHKSQPITFLTITIVSGILLFYVWLHLQFVREHEQALLAEQRIQIMMTQIQPHFLYNTLATIQALCRIDPEKAFDITEKFGTYLRQNIDSLKQPDLIPLRKELEHTKVYAEIEMHRFPKIQITYQIEDEAFCLPALTIQPMVENAIRHGVRIRKNGLIEVRTRREENWHVIEIADNGKGFDVETMGTPETGHIGVANVKERIEQMCDGTLTIESVPDEGTTVTIRIPVKADGE
ncbi:MAG: histidine kinase [Lachnospiraceae bacterium]|nr:histidine kinase [Lachnospiraceae bacterium]